MNVLLNTESSELCSLRDVSARLGVDPLLVQAGTGNTSIKIGGVLWIKASGKWLAHARRDDILVPVDLAEARAHIRGNMDPAHQWTVLCGKSRGQPLRTSVETAMHAVLPDRVVLHVHSVNTIAWAVRRDLGALEERFEGLRWKWICYRSSGLALAHEIERALGCSPGTNVFILANHGLVVCADDCEAAEALLRDVEARVAITPRPPPAPDYARLAEISQDSHWRLPEDTVVHSPGTDPLSRMILSTGVLYPCQAIFLSPAKYWIVDGAGVVIQKGTTATVRATLAALAQVLQRIDDASQVNYLKESEVDRLLNADVYRYRDLVESNGPRSALPLEME